MPSNATGLDLTHGPDREAGIFAILRREHRTVAGLMEQISHEESEKARARTFETLYRVLHPHAKGEEETLYARLVHADPSREITLEGVQEHRVVATLLGELRDMATHGDTWMAKFKVLEENVKHHVEEEEGELFSKAREVLSGAEEKEVARAYEAARNGHLANLDAE